jgi:hypothetical protein
LAHVAASLRYGLRIEEHGPEWLEYMTRAGFKPRAVIEEVEIRTRIGSGARRKISGCG